MGALTATAAALVMALAADEAAPEETAITLTPAADTLDGGGETRIEISVSGTAVAPMPRLFASAGTIAAPERTADRHFVARFVAPDARFPQRAIIAAELDGGARGFTTVALPADAAPAFRTRPGARVSIALGGRSFGPVVAGKDGEVRVPIVVPPGIATAQARVVDTAGRESARTIDLRPPPFAQLLLLAPSVLIAGALVEVGLVGIESGGGAVDESRLVLRSGHLRPHPLGARAGVARYLVRVPPRIEAGPLRLSAHLRAVGSDEGDFTDSRIVTLPIQPGPLARLTLSPQQARLVVSGTDLWGHPVPVDDVEIFVDGRPARLETTDVGRAVVVSDDPVGPRPRRPIDVEAIAHGLYAYYRLEPGGGSAAPPATEIAPRLLLLGAIGTVWGRAPGFGTTARLALEATHAVIALPLGLRPGIAIGYLGKRVRTSDGPARSALALDQVVLLGRLGARHAGPADIEIGAGAAVGLSELRVGSAIDGVNVASHHTGPAFEASAEAARTAGPGALALGVRYLRVPLGRLPNGDLMAGNGGGLVLDLGYRVGF